MVREELVCLTAVVAFVDNVLTEIPSLTRGTNIRIEHVLCRLLHSRKPLDPTYRSKGIHHFSCALSNPTWRWPRENHQENHDDFHENLRKIPLEWRIPLLDIVRSLIADGEDTSEDSFRVGDRGEGRLGLGNATKHQVCDNRVLG